MKLVLSAALIGVLSGQLQAASVTLTGQVRDFCAPSIVGLCTTLDDFEGMPTGLVTGMVSSTLNSNGLPTYVGNGIGGTNAADFAKWYTDSPGYNVTSPYSLTLFETSPGSGIYTYSDSSFFPLDNAEFGNQGRPHNYHFTVQLDGTTSFKATDSFTFTGDDDLWVYIGGKLVVDLGGVHSAVGTTITGADLMLLGLMQNTVYSMDIFFAERHTVESNFNITTSFQLQPGNNTGFTPEPSTWMPVGLGLAAVALKRMIKK